MSSPGKHPFSTESIQSQSADLWGRMHSGTGDSLISCRACLACSVPAGTTQNAEGGLARYSPRPPTTRPRPRYTHRDLIDLEQTARDRKKQEGWNVTSLVTFLSCFPVTDSPKQSLVFYFEV